MRQHLFVTFCALLGVQGASRADVLVRVDGQAAGLAGREMGIDGAFTGVVGDTILLTEGKHSLRVALLEGFDGRQRLEVSQDQAAATPMTSGDCIGTTSWSLKNWAPPAVRKEGAILVLTLATAHPVKDGNCSNEPSSLHCTEKPAIVTVHSIPEIGAEIWIDGKSTNASTGTSISVPFCVGTSPRKDVVLRKKGYANCSTSLQITDRADNYDVNCSLKKLAD